MLLLYYILAGRKTSLLNPRVWICHMHGWPWPNKLATASCALCGMTLVPWWLDLDWSHSLASVQWNLSIYQNNGLLDSLMSTKEKGNSVDKPLHGGICFVNYSWSSKQRSQCACMNFFFLWDIFILSIRLQKPTVIFVNASLCLGVALLLGSLSSGVLPNDLTAHLLVLLSLMIGLILAFNWYEFLGYFSHAQ